MYFAVWKGREIGVFDGKKSMERIKGYKGAVSKKFGTYEDAVEALIKGPSVYGVSNKLDKEDLKKIKKVYEQLKEIGDGLKNVDGINNELKNKINVNSQIGVNLGHAYCVDASRFRKGNAFFL